MLEEKSALGHVDGLGQLSEAWSLHTYIYIYTYNHALVWKPLHIYIYT